MAESTQHKLDRVKPPRVQITYDVEIGNAIIARELPYVVGVLANLSGQNTAAVLPLKERKFVEVDRDNFDEVLKSINPQLQYSVKNVIDGSTPETHVELSFKEILDFEPLQVLQQIEPLAKLYKIRSLLSDLITKLDGNEPLDNLLTTVINSKELQNQLKKQISAFKQKNLSGSS